MNTPGESFIRVPETGFIESPSFELALLQGSCRNPGLELARFPFAKIAYAAMKIMLRKPA